jgi:hypothetical protein
MSAPRRKRKNVWPFDPGQPMGSREYVYDLKQRRKEEADQTRAEARAKLRREAEARREGARLVREYRAQEAEDKRILARERRIAAAEERQLAREVQRQADRERRLLGAKGKAKVRKEKLLDQEAAKGIFGGLLNPSSRRDYEQKIQDLESDVWFASHLREQPPRWAKDDPKEWAKTLREADKDADRARLQIPILQAKRDAIIDAAKAKWEAKGSPMPKQGKRKLQWRVVDSKGNVPAGRKNVVPALALTSLPQLQSEAEQIRKLAGLSTSKRKKRNPESSEASAAREMTESFHGRRENEVFVIDEKVFRHSDLGELGELISLKIKAPGRKVTLDHFDGTILCASGIRHEKRQHKWTASLYLRGGDQRVNVAAFGIETPMHDFEDLGEITEIRYYTTKEHLGSEGGEATYYHETAEEDKARNIRPRHSRLIASTRDDRLLIVGGAYSVKPEGIAN